MPTSIRKIGQFIPDSLYISIVYFHHFHKFPNLRHPKTMNEKLQWLKLHDRRPEYTEMVDKVTAKGYAARIIGEKHIIPTLGVWESVDVIDFDTLPEQFVLKCNHDSGSVVICKDKTKLDRDATCKKLARGLSRSGFWYGREWPYKAVVPKVLAEPYLTDGNGSDQLTDYKFYCFNGEVDCVLGCYDRSTGDPKFYFFDREWNLKRYNKRGKAAPEGFIMPKPENMNEMFSVAEKLAKAVNAAFLRVDLYSVKNKVYFGELTLYPASGFDANRLPEIDLLFGSKIKLPIDRPIS